MMVSGSGIIRELAAVGVHFFPIICCLIVMIWTASSWQNFRPPVVITKYHYAIQNKIFQT